MNKKRCILVINFRFYVMTNSLIRAATSYITVQNYELEP